MVCAQERGRLRRDRFGVISSVGSVGRADFDQLRTGLLHHVRHAEPAANFDQLSARHDHLFAFGQRAKREQNGGGGVVHNESGLRARDLRQQ